MITAAEKERMDNIRNQVRTGNVGLVTRADRQWLANIIRREDGMMSPAALMQARAQGINVDGIRPGTPVAH